MCRQEFDCVLQGRMAKSDFSAMVRAMKTSASRAEYACRPVMPRYISRRPVISFSVRHGQAGRASTASVFTTVRLSSASVEVGRCAARLDTTSERTGVGGVRPRSICVASSVIPRPPLAHACHFDFTRISTLQQHNVAPDTFFPLNNISSTRSLLSVVNELKAREMKIVLT